MHFQIPLPCNCFMSIIFVYTLIHDSNGESVMTFYWDLKSVITFISNTDNWWFQCRSWTWSEDQGSTRENGQGKMNCDDHNFLQFYTEFELVICNTVFHQKNGHKVIWANPRSKHGHILTYIITWKQYFPDVYTVQVMQGALCGTDHVLLYGKWKHCIMHKIWSEEIKFPKHVLKMKDSKVCKNLWKAIEEVKFDGIWD